MTKTKGTTKPWQAWSRGKLLLFVLVLAILVIAIQLITRGGEGWLRVVGQLLTLLFSVTLLYVGFSWSVHRDRIDQPRRKRR